jgi:ATP-dependent helicase HrpB
VRSERRAVVVAPPGAGKTTRIPPALALHTRPHDPAAAAARRRARARARIALERGWTIGERDRLADPLSSAASPRARAARRDGRHPHRAPAIRSAAQRLRRGRARRVSRAQHSRGSRARAGEAGRRHARRSRGRGDVGHDGRRAGRAFLGAKVDRDRCARVIRSTSATHRMFRWPQAMRETVAKTRGHILCFLPGAREIEDVRRAIPGERAAAARLARRRRAGARARAVGRAQDHPRHERRRDVAHRRRRHRRDRLRIAEACCATTRRPRSIISSPSRSRSTPPISAPAARVAPHRDARLRLWDERAILRPQREPEVRRVDLASPVLDILAWGGDPRTFEWFERPPEASHRAARSSCCAASARPKTSSAACAHSAASAARARADRWRRSGGARLRAAVRGHPRHRQRRCVDARRFAATRLRRTRARAIRERKSGDVRRALLAGYPDRVAMRREPGSLRLLLSSGTGAALAKESGMHEASSSSRSTSAAARSRSCASPASSSASGSRRRTKDVVHTIKDDGTVRATKRVWYDALLLREINVAPDPLEAHRLTEEWKRANRSRARAPHRIRRRRRTRVISSRRNASTCRAAAPRSSSIRKTAPSSPRSNCRSSSASPTRRASDRARRPSRSRCSRRRTTRADHARPAQLLERRVSGSAQGIARALSATSVARGSVDGAGHASDDEEVVGGLSRRRQ